ncbi:mite group 2 allergen-like Ixo r 2 [Haemaphysalis longicornis]
MRATPATMIRYVVALLVVGFAAGQLRNIKFKDCGSKAKIQALQLEPCDSDPCVVKRDSRIKVQLTGLSNQDSKTAVLDAEMKMWFFWMSIPGLKSNLCSYALQCPISKGETFTAVLKAGIPSVVPFKKTEVKFKIKGDKGVIVCAESSITID